MSDIKTKLDKLTASIAAEAAAEAMGIIKDVKASRKISASEAEREISEETSRRTAERIAGIKLRETQRVSTSAMENKRRVLELREEYLKTIQDEVSRKLSVFTKSEDYGPYLADMLNKALSVAGNDIWEAELYIRSGDLYLESLLQKTAAGVKLTVREGHFEMGGLILKVPSRNLIIDMSFDAEFKKLPGNFAELLNMGGRN